MIDAFHLDWNGIDVGIYRWLLHSASSQHTLTLSLSFSLSLLLLYLFSMSSYPKFRLHRVMDMNIKCIEKESCIVSVSFCASAVMSCHINTIVAYRILSFASFSLPSFNLSLIKSRMKTNEWRIAQRLDYKKGLAHTTNKAKMSIHTHAHVHTWHEEKKTVKTMRPSEKRHEQNKLTRRIHLTDATTAQPTGSKHVCFNNI